MEQVGRTRGRMVEVDSLDAFDALLAAGARSMSGWRVQDVDLRGRGTDLRRLDPGGALLLGCELGGDDEGWLRARGALVFPDVPGLPVNAYRTTLYSAAELYDGLAQAYEQTLDARVYAWSRRTEAGQGEASAALAQALHDHAIDDALAEFVDGQRVAGVMGGHALARTSPEYAEAALLGRELGRLGLLVTTGGGPGAMEAANLGARASDLDRPDLLATVGALGVAPDFRPSVTRWARVAFAALEGLPGDHLSLGLPTWFYGHEPPSAFATHIAKFFRNALREALLVRICTAGIVFLPGAAGTVQEVFQDACENYYADPTVRTPMIMMGRRHWTETLPVWPLLRSLAEQRGFPDRVALVDSPEEVAALLGAGP